MLNQGHWTEQDADAVISYVLAKKKHNIRIDWNTCGTLVKRSARQCYDLYRSRTKQAGSTAMRPRVVLQEKVQEKKVLFSLMKDEECSLMDFCLFDEYV